MKTVPSSRLATTSIRVCFAMYGCVVLLALPALAQQSGSSGSGSGQSSAQSKQQNQQSAPPAHKGAAQDNPFPSDVSQHAVQQPQGDQPAAPPDAPGAPDPGQSATPPAQKSGDAAKDNPFPEDVSKGAAAAAAKANDAGSSGADAGSSSSSSSSSNPGGDAASGDTDPNADLPRDSGRRRLRKPSDKDIQSGSLAGTGRAQDDVRIGRFYLNDRDYNGAYGRFAEATRLDPVNVDAIYGLAAAAEGLHHNDEALTNYKLYLQVAPDGEQAKLARKAIHTLSK